MILASVESAPTFVALISMRPVPLMAPPVTVAPTFLGHRQAFTGNQRFVDFTEARHDLAIDRNPFAGLDDDDVTGHDFADRQLLIAAVRAV